MKRNIYECPTAQVVQFEYQAQVLEGSSLLNATRSGYGAAETETWGEDEE